MRRLKDILCKIEGQAIMSDPSCSWTDDIEYLKSFRDIDSLESKKIIKVDKTDKDAVEVYWPGEGLIYLKDDFQVCKADVQKLGRRISRIYSLYPDRTDLLEVVDEMLPILAKTARKYGLAASDMRYRQEKGNIFLSDLLADRISQDEKKKEALMAAIRDVLLYKKVDADIQGEHVKESGKRVALLLLALEELEWIKPIDGRTCTIKNWRKVLSVMFSSDGKESIKIGTEEAINRVYRDKNKISKTSKTKKYRQLYWGMAEIRDCLKAAVR